MELWFDVLLLIGLIFPVKSATVCGQAPQKRSSTSLRIVGGSVARSGAYPWQVFVLKQGRPHCGGSIIGSTWVLTAAHCMYRNRGSKTIVAGSRYWNNRDGKATMHRVVREIIYRQYDSENYYGDIGLIQVRPPFTFKTEGRGAVQPVCLPNVNQNVSATTGIISGYGATNEASSPSSVLLYAKVKILEDRHCQRAYRSAPRFQSSVMICAGYTRGQVDSCQGDSGGPLTVIENNVVVQVGVVSFGRGCGRKGFPGVYTKVASFRSWIKSVTGI